MPAFKLQDFPIARPLHYGRWFALIVLTSVLTQGCANIGITAEPRIATGLNYEPDELDLLDDPDRFADDSSLLDRRPTINSNAPSPSSYEESAKTGWQERTFHGKTRYTVLGKNTNPTIRGETNGTASLLYKQQRVNVATTPLFSWRWKITNTYSEIDELSKSGDDFPARLYIVAQTGPLPWDTKAINYIWSSQQPVGKHWNNPFTDNAKMVVLQSGDALTGKWVTENRNVVNDFKQFFNIDVQEISGIAVMVDGDNSKNAATAWFSDIQFYQN